MKIVSVGVDWGGTWLRAVGIDQKRKQAFSEKLPSPHQSHLVPTLRLLWKKHRLQNLPVLVLGGKGIWKKSVRIQWKKRLRPLARRVVVMSDVEIAHQAAFVGRPGVLILAGTGSIAYGINPNGKWARAGGLGPERGDEGSGYWIGKRYLKSLPPSVGEGQDGGKAPLTAFGPPPQSSPMEGGGEIRRIAALAPIVLAKKSNSRCLVIIKEAQDHLAQLIVDTAKHLWRNGMVPVSWAGGLMDDRFFQEGVFRKARYLLSESRLKLKVVSPRHEPVEAAALLGLHFFPTKK